MRKVFWMGVALGWLTGGGVWLSTQMFTLPSLFVIAKMSIGILLIMGGMAVLLRITTSARTRQSGGESAEDLINHLFAELKRVRRNMATVEEANENGPIQRYRLQSAVNTIEEGE